MTGSSALGRDAMWETTSSSTRWKVTKKLSFDSYYRDPRFRRKIPIHGLIEERGDNLHYKGRLGEGIDRSYHSTAEQIDHDLSGQYVLISDCFNYFGRNAVALSDHTLVKEGPGHRSKFPDEKRLNEPQYGFGVGWECCQFCASSMALFTALISTPWIVHPFGIVFTHIFYPLLWRAQITHLEYKLKEVVARLIAFIYTLFTHGAVDISKFITIRTARTRTYSPWCRTILPVLSRVLHWTVRLSHHSLPRVIIS